MFATVARNEEPYIAEWIAFHLLQGVTSFLIFDNGSDDNTPAIAQRFGDAFDVRVIPWPTQDGTFFLSVQKEAFAAALNVARGGMFDWIMFTDPDEFTFGENGTTVAECLADIPEEIGALAIKRYEFGSNYRRAKPSKGLVIENFARSVSDEFARSPGFIKTFSRPHAVLGMQDTPHSVTVANGFRYGYPDGAEVTHNEERHGLVENTRIGKIIQHHYITKSLAEFYTKRARYVGKTRKIEDSFYWNREVACNAVARPTLVGLGERVRQKMAEVGL